MEEGTLSSLEFEFEGLRVKAEKQSAVTVTAAAVSTTAAAQIQEVSVPIETGTPVKSPLVGTFYASPSPGEKAFVAVGDTVSKGDTLCIVEAMKMLNTIESPCGGKVKAVLISDGQMVEYGQTLLVIE